MAEGITKRSEDYSRWYTDIVMKAELADYAPVKGCMVIRPYGFAIWENMKSVLDGMIKETGHQNAYFPLFIPRELYDEGSGTRGRIRAGMRGCDARWREEARREPLRAPDVGDDHVQHVLAMDQVVARPALSREPVGKRGSVGDEDKAVHTDDEFLWQEGHTAHETHEESEKEVLQMLGIYKKFATEYLALPVFDGVKSESEKFAGALKTYAIEGMMQDKRALQAGTSHDLGQNFAKAFEIQFQSRDGKLEHVWQTSWGVSTRLVGALVMAHSDDQGLILPPKIAPIPVVLVPIYRDPAMRNKVLTAAKEIQSELAQVTKVHIDDRQQYTPGWKFNEWELKGVPIRIEIGPRDLDRQQVVLVRRDNGEKMSVSRNALAARTKELLDEVQEGIYNKALKFRDENTVQIDSYDEFKAKMEDGVFALSHWCGNAECEGKIKDETKATVRVLAFETPEEEGKCLICGGDSHKRAIFAKAY